MLLETPSPSPAGEAPAATENGDADRYKPDGSDSAKTPLDRRVLEFFQTEDAGTRSQLLNAIVNDPESDPARVAQAVRRVRLWEPVSSGLDAFEVKFGGGLRTLVRVRVPESYDSTNRYPLILALHDRGRNALSYVRFLEQILGDEVEKYIIAAPEDYKGTWFFVTRAESAEPTAILEALRHRYHLDTDRVYVNGYSMGGHGAFMTAVLYTDWFASAIALAGTFTTPNTPETKAILMPNLSDFPVLVVWGENDTRVHHLEDAYEGGIAGLNRTLRAELPNMGINRIEFLELEDKGHRDVVPPRDRFLHYLQLRRDHDRERVSHWFRFPAQGRTGWLRQTEFAGEPWEGQMVVQVRPGTDLHEYARRTVRQKLALIEGAIEGQTIRIRLRHTKKAEILLHDGLIDFSQPITVYRGKKIVYRGPVTPKVSTLLETAYTDWEFQRLCSVRLVVPARGAAWQK